MSTKRILFSASLVALALLSSNVAVAQTQTTTPNLALQIPYDEEVNWGPLITGDLTAIDSVIGGTQSAIWSVKTTVPFKITNATTSAVLFTTDLTGNLSMAGGGNFGGPVLLPANPTLALQASPKQYVDTAVAAATALANTAQTTANSAVTTANSALSTANTAETQAAAAVATANSVAAQSGALLITNNLSDLGNASTARTNLGLGSAAVTAASAYDAAGAAAAAQAAAIAASDPVGSATTAANTAQTNAIAVSVQKANNLSDLANIATARTNLGLGSAATTASTAYDAAGAATTALTSAVSSSLQKSNNLSDLVNPATARTNLGLGSAATTASTAYDAAGAAAAAQAASDPAGSATTAQANAIAVSVQKANNLSDLANVATARTNLGLGSAAVTSSSAYDVSGAASSAQAAAIAVSLQRASNLSDLTNTATARTNLGLGTAATHGATTTVNGQACTLDGTCSLILPGFAMTSATTAVPTNYSHVNITLAGPYSFTIGAGSDGQIITLTFIQGSTAYTVTPPSNVAGFFSVGTTVNKRNTQTYMYDLASATWFPYGGAGESNY